MTRSAVGSFARRGKKIFLFLPIIAMISLSSSSWAAKGMSTRPPDTDSVFQETDLLLQKENPSATDMQKVVITLQGLRTKFPDDARVPIGLAEAYYKMADPAADIKEAFPLYEKAGKYAQEALKMDSGRPEAHYWYGLFLLKKAQNSGKLSAYFHTKHGIKELEQTRETMPEYDHGGPSRILGLLYCLAPGWSPFGDIEKSVKLAEEATAIDPDFLLNRVYLAQAYEKQGNKEGAKEEFRKIVKLCSKQGEEGQQALEKARRMLSTLGEKLG